MGYTQYFPQVKNVPDTQWETLCAKVREAFGWIQNQYLPSLYEADFPVTICDGPGEKIISDVTDLFSANGQKNVIFFNGQASRGLGYEAFFLSQKKLKDFSFCKTAAKPYDWFVVVVLILVHNLCPGCFDISSDGEVQDWEPVLKWLNERSGVDYLMPIAG